MNISWRQATTEDKSWLMALRLKTMVPHLEKAGLFLSSEQHDFRMNEAFECSHILSVDDIPCGLVKFCHDNDVIELQQLQILPEFQGRGIGKAVLTRLSALAGKVTLTVLKENPALALYRRAGFVVTGEDEYEYHMEKITVARGC